MNALTIYSLLSHRCDFLPFQVAAFRRYCPGRIVCVVDSKYPPEGAFRARLECAGLELIEGPPLPSSGPWSRGDDLATWVAATLATAQQEPHAMIVHGDLWPVADCTAETVLEGKPLGGWASARPDGVRLTSNLLVIDTTQVAVMRLQGWPVDAVRIWNARRVHGDWPQVPALANRPELLLEWIEPCFFHAGQMSIRGLADRKIEAIRAVFPCAPY